MKNFQQLFKNQRGSVTVEMAFVIMGFVLILAIIVDFGVVMLRQSKLERTNASLASVFRERETFYRQTDNDDNYLGKYASEEIDQAQATQLGLLGIELLNEPDLSMRIDAVYFSADPLTPTVDRSLTFYFGSSQCGPNIAPLADLTHLSPFSGFNRWMPLYRVTTCIPGRTSWYKNIISPNLPNENTVDSMMISNITLPR